MLYKWLFWLGIAASSGTVVNSAAKEGNSYLSSIQAEEALFQTLFQPDYNKLVRPVVNSDDVLDVYVKLTVRQLFGIDEKNQLMHTNVWLKKSWIDINLRWNPENFGNLTTVRVPSEWIWLPDVVLLENSDGNFTVSHMTRALIRYDGNVTWEPPANYRSWCNVDVTYFPFDVQNCSMKFASWTYSTEQVQLKPWGDEIDVSQLLDNGEWEIVNAVVTAEHEQNSFLRNLSIDGIFTNQGLRYFIVLKRLPLFYIVFLITPCLGISVLTGLVFYLPTASQEKVTLCTSVLLAHTFYLLVITEIIPSTSNTIPLIGEYLLFTMIFITLAIAVSTIIISIHYRTTKTHRPIPRGLRSILFELGPKLVSLNEFTRRFKADEKSLTARKASKMCKVLHNCKQILRSSEFPKDSNNQVIIRCLRFLMKRIKKRVKEQKVYIIVRNIFRSCQSTRLYTSISAVSFHVIFIFLPASEEWMYAAMILDRIFLLVFFCICCVGALLVFLPGLISSTIYLSQSDSILTV